MSKYIIELGEDANMVQVISVTQSGNAYIDSTVYVEYLEQLNSDYINEHYGSLQDEAYKRGINDGSLDVKQRVEGAYQRGFEDGKAIHEKGCEGCKYGGTPQGDSQCFSCSNYYKNNWTAKDDKIKVGDEVEWDNDFFTGDRFIVTRIYQPYGKKEQCDGIDDDGDVYRAVLIESLVKTGRHFDIASILEEMRK